MGRFDREDVTSNEADAATGAAAAKLRSTLEQQVHEVVQEAMDRAHAIEDRALARANVVKLESQRTATEALQSSIDRAEGMLGAIETLQGELVKVIASFREETEILRSGLKEAKQSLEPAQKAPAAPTPAPRPAGPAPVHKPDSKPAPAPAARPQPAPAAAPAARPTPAAPKPAPAAAPKPAPVAEPKPALAAEPRPAPAAAPKPAPPGEPKPTPPAAAPKPPPTAEAKPTPTTEPKPAPAAAEPKPAPAAAPEQKTDPKPPSPTVDGQPSSSPPGDQRAGEMIRQQLKRLRDTGKPREDAERYLARFKQGNDYKAMLDEFYPPGEEQQPRRRRGLLRRK